MTPPSAPQLDYAPAPPRSKHWAAARRVARWLGLGALILAAVWYGPSVWRQVWYLRGQQRCLEFAMPAGQVAYANDPAAATTLLAAGYQPVGSAMGRALGATPAGASMSAGYVPPVLAQVGEQTMGYYSNTGWGYVRQGVSNAPLRTGAFVHGRRNAVIGERLVGIVFLERQDAPGGERRLEINALSWRPATWEPGSRLQLAALTNLVVPNLDRKRVRIFAGQIDPVNQSHFTMAYDIDGRAGTIDGYLDVYERVTLQFRDGPGTEWAAPGPAGLGYQR